jgi:hypothetical protein
MCGFFILAGVKKVNCESEFVIINLFKLNICSPAMPQRIHDFLFIGASKDKSKLKILTLG